MSREIERYNLLESKFKDLLVKFNIVSKENTKNKDLVFNLTTGAQFPKYDNFLDDDGEFRKGRKAETNQFNELDDNFGGRGRGDGADDELNQINQQRY